MERRREIVIFLCVVALAFTLEFFKGVGRVDIKNDKGLTGSDLRGLQTTPFSRHVEDDSRIIKGSRQTRAGFKLASIGTLNKDTGTADLGKGKARGKTAAIDAKKKKKKKKIKKSAEKVNSDLNAKNYEEEETRDAAEPTSSLNSGGPGLASVKTPTEYDSALTVWLRKLLARPDKSLTQEFIREFQSGKIQTDVFYTVVDALLKAEDPDFHDLGLFCASETPSLRSYNTLTGVIVGGSYGPGATSQALEDAKAYEFLQLLWIPRNLLSQRQSGDTQLIALAANTIERSTFRYLGQTSNTGTAYNSSVESVFRSLAPVLTRAINTHRGQASIVTPLQTALDRIRQSNLVAATTSN